LDVAGFETVPAAIAAVMTDDTPGERPRTLAQRRADGLVALAHFFLDHATAVPVGRRRRPPVAVTMTLDDLEQRGPAGTAEGGSGAGGLGGGVVL
jgi:hypothetical protein